MNRKQLIDSLQKNWPAKVICFAIAIFLYLFYQASLIDKKTFVIPLDIKEQGIVVHVGSVPSSVVVSVRASENDIKAIFASDMSASIDLNNITKSGNYRIPINVEISDKLKSLDPLEVKLKEETLKISVEKKVSRYVKVVPSVVGEVHEDFAIKNIKMDPSTVQIIGPDSLISAITEIYTERVNVSNAMTNFTVETGYNKVSDFVTINESTPCKATIVLEPRVDEYILTGLPYKMTNLSNELQVKEPLPSYDVKLRGPVTKYKKLSILKLPVTLDFENIKEPGVYEIPVSFPIPLDFEIIEKTGDTISVEIIEKTDSSNEDLGVNL